MKQVTLGWDGLPTIVNDDGTMYPREAELIFHAEYYPNWPKERWPEDPKTGKKLPLDSRGKEILRRHSSRHERGSSEGVGDRIR